MNNKTKKPATSAKKPKAFKLKTVTPRALKVYKKHGLLDAKKENAEKVGLELFNLFCDEKDLPELLDVTFAEDFSIQDIDEIDLTLVMGGVADFLLQLSRILK